MNINNVEFGADCYDIIQELQTQLHINNIQLISKIIDTPNNVQVCCPYHHNGQERRPSAGIKKSDGTFHCFSGETKVITYEYGAIEMSSVQGLPVHILNGNGKWEEVVFNSYGQQPLMKITLSANTKQKIIYATPEHEWIIKGYNKKYQTQDLKVGMHLQKIIPTKLSNSVKLDPKGIVHGFCYGDGINYGHNVNGVWYHRCYFYNESDLELKPYFKEIGAKFLQGFAGNNREYQYALFHVDRNFKEVPSITDSTEYLLGFLAGYFVADGNCFNNKLTIYSHRYKDLYKIQQICTRLGIVSTEIGVSNIKAGQRGCVVVKKDTHGYTLRLVRNTIPDNFFITNKGRSSVQKFTGRNSYKVISVERTDRFENVYCCQTSTHSFALEHFILTGNCFACGEVHTLPEVISYCFGHTDDILGKFGWQWLLKNFATISIEERKDVDLDFERHIDNCISNNSDSMASSSDCSSGRETTSYISEEELDRYRYYHPYWQKRGIRDERIIELFDLGYDSATNCITMPIRDTKGSVCFVARRSVKTKWFNYPQGVHKPIYGLYEYNRQREKLAYMYVGRGNGKSQAIAQIMERLLTVFICESMIDALLLWQSGFFAFALNGLGSESQIEELKKLPIRSYILCTDNDEAGEKARRELRKKLGDVKLITEIDFPNGIKDVGECTEEQINNILDWEVM